MELFLLFIIRGAMFNSTKVTDVKKKSGKGTKNERKGDLIQIFEI